MTHDVKSICPICRGMGKLYAIDGSTPEGYECYKCHGEGTIDVQIWSSEESLDA